jgi:hypothetical protein
LAILLDSLTSFLFEDCPALVMNLMRCGKPLGGGLDLHGAAYPHVHRQPKNCIGGELVQVNVEVPKDIDDGGMKGEPKPRKQEIPEDDDLIVARLRYGLPARGSGGPDHAVLLKRAHIGPVDLAAAKGVCLRDFLCDGAAPSFWGHGCDLRAK